VPLAAPHDSRVAQRLLANLPPLPSAPSAPPQPAAITTGTLQLTSRTPLLTLSFAPADGTSPVRLVAQLDTPGLHAAFGAVLDLSADDFANATEDGRTYVHGTADFSHGALNTFTPD
jgi:hypothetical protein